VNATKPLELVPSVNVSWGRSGDLYVPENTAAPEPAPAPGDAMDTPEPEPEPDPMTAFVVERKHARRVFRRIGIIVGHVAGWSARVTRRWAPRIGAVLAVGIVFASVGGPAAVASYLHSIHVAEHYGADPRVTDWLPLTTDGMLVAALVLMGIQRWRGQTVAKFAWFTFGAGMLATVGANIGAYLINHMDNVAQPVEIGGIVVAMWPPFALALTLELVAMTVNVVRGKPARTGRAKTPKPSPKPEEKSKPAGTTKGPKPEKTSSTKTTTGKPALTDDQVMEKARAYMAEHGTTEITPGTLRRLYGVGTPRAARLAKTLTEG
jgi:hypothetical protein